MFTKATKTKAKLRMAIMGAAGSGKTYTALLLATALAEAAGKRAAVIDTEHGSASKYAGDPFDFDAAELRTYGPRDYVKIMEGVDPATHGALVIDSLSHAWMGKGGALDQVDRLAAGKDNSFTAWRTVTPQHNELVEALLTCPTHLVVTLRAKTEYVVEKNERGKSVPRKVGLAPVQRDGLEYEFDVVADMDQDNVLTVTKTRCSALRGAVIPQPGRELAESLLAWLDQGEDPAEAAARRHREAVERVNALVTAKHNGTSAEYVAGVLKSLGDKAGKAYQEVADLPVAALDHWAAKLAAK